VATGLGHRGRVDDGHGFLQVLHHEAVEEGLVAVEQAGQEDVLVHRGGFGVPLAPHPFQLLFDGARLRREQAAQVEGLPLLGGEGGALVQQGFGEELPSACLHR